MFGGARDPVRYNQYRRFEGVMPVHTLDEILLLQSRFPSQIRCLTANNYGEAIAGVVIFDTKTTCHAQYIASSEKGRACGALELIFESLIKEAGERRKQYFNFGISTEEQGLVVNDGLLQFKAEFGSGSLGQFKYELELS
jgi:lipid II:glycine glycyltransferase (peptidoglycan interpeptide bridge formation enzyme)